MAYTAAQKRAWMLGRYNSEVARGVHSKGIDALPRVQDVAPKIDWAARNAAHAAEVKARDAARGVGQVPSSRPPNPFGKSGTLAKQVNDAIDKQLKELAPKKKSKGPSLDQIKAAVRAGKNLHAETPSTCLELLTYRGKDQVAVARFYRGGQIEYEYPMDVEDFLDWAQSNSLGKYGNAYVFD